MLHVLAVAPPPPFHIQYAMRFQTLVDNVFIFFYVWVVIGDIITGFVKSLVVKHTTSTKGINGLFKHAALMLLILTLYPVLDLLGWDSLADTFISFYIIFYAVSIMENLGQMGIPFPSWLKKYLYKLSDEYNEDPKGKK